MQLTGNTLLITGGTSGIGYELTQQFYALGNQLIVIGRNTDRLDRLREAFPGLTTYPCDVAVAEQRLQLIDRIRQSHPELNVLINNAGIQYNYEIGRHPDAVARIAEEVETNLVAPLTLTALCLPILMQQNHSAVVNISSGLGLVPKQSAPVYCGTKAGLHIFTKALRYQLAQSSVKVFEVIPPLVDTPMTQGRGEGKLSTDQLVREFLIAFRKDVPEINIGKVKLLRGLHRVFPRLAERMLKDK